MRQPTRYSIRQGDRVERDPETGILTQLWDIHSSYHGEAITTGLTLAQAVDEVKLMLQLDAEAQAQGRVDQHDPEAPSKPLRSSLNLHIEITHSRNLHTDAQGLATEVEAFLTNRLAQYDNLGSATASLQSAAIARRGS